MFNFPKKIKFFQVFLVLLFSFLFTLLWNNSDSYLDPDFGWHLKIGEEISFSGQVPTKNYYNYTFSGNWVDHEWLGDLWLYQIYQVGGYMAVSFFFVFLTLVALVILYIRIRRFWPESDNFYLIILGLFGLLASLPSLGVRLQTFGLFFVALLLLIIESYDRRRSWLILLFLPLLFYFWACLHASFLLGLALLLAWPLFKILERALARFWPRDWLDLKYLFTWREIILAALASAGSFAITLFTPYRLELYSFLGGYQNSFYKYHLQEWLSQFVFPFQYPQLAYLALVAFALFLYFYHSLGKDKRFQINVWQLFLVLLFFYLSWESRRHFPLLFVAILPWLGFVYSRIFNFSLADRISFLKSWSLPLALKIFLILCLVLVSIKGILFSNFNSNPFYAFCDEYPCLATDFLRSHIEYNDFNIFNHYSWGGYLLWNLPERRLFIDGRLPQVAFAGHTFLEEYFEFFKEDRDIAAKLDQYKIRLVLIPAQDKRWPIKKWEKLFFRIKDKDLEIKNNLRDYLQRSEEWEKIYVDQTALIYIRN